MRLISSRLQRVQSLRRTVYMWCSRTSSLREVTPKEVTITRHATTRVKGRDKESGGGGVSEDSRIVAVQISDRAIAERTYSLLTTLRTTSHFGLLS